MLRFNISRLLREKEEMENRRIPLKELGEATGISISVLSTLASPRVGASTNTRFLEALCRYFGCSPSDLIELVPPNDETTSSHVDELYPSRGAHRRIDANDS